MQVSPQSKKELEQDPVEGLEQDREDPIYDDKSFASYYQDEQLKLAEEKYKRLREIQYNIKHMELPGFPSSVRSPRRPHRACQSVGRLSDIQGSPLIATKGNLLSTPSRIKDLIQYGSARPQRLPITSSYKKMRDQIFSREKSPNTLNKAKREIQEQEEFVDYRAKLILEKAQLRLKDGLFVPLASRQCKSREMARSISVQKVSAKKFKRNRKLKKLLKGEGLNRKVLQLAPLNMLERASTVYKGYGPVGLGRFPSIKYMAQTVSPQGRREAPFLLSSKK